MPRGPSSAHHHGHDRPRVVIVGGGVAALECLLALCAELDGAVSVQLIAPQRHFAYRPTAVLTPFRDRMPERLPLATIAAEHGAELLRDALDVVQPGEQTIITQGRAVIGYDELVVAVGARYGPVLPGALPFRGPEDAPAVRRIVDDLHRRATRAVAFVVPKGLSWPLPAYELALQAALNGQPGHVHLVTTETEPLGIFGATPSAAVREELHDAGVHLHTGATATSFDGERLWLGAGVALRCGAAVALPLPAGPWIAGLPHDRDGFIPVDALGRVPGTGVHAAGDGTDAKIKQGGLAAQQADAVARSVGARVLGLDPPAPPGPPVLRAMLLTGGGRRFLRRDMALPDGEVADEAPWWPPAKVAAPRLAPYLASHATAAPAAVR